MFIYHISRCIFHFKQFAYKNLESVKTCYRYLYSMTFFITQSFLTF